MQKKLKMNEFFSNPNLDIIPIPAFWVNSAARVIHVNQAACDQLGYPYEELINLSIQDISLNFQPYRWDELFKLISSNRIYVFESRHFTRTGKIIPVEVTATYMEINDQKLILGFANEISQRMLNEHLSRENSLMLEAIFNYIDDALGVIDSAYQILLYNPAAKKLLNLTDDSYLGKKCYEIFGNSYRCEDCPSQKAFETAKPVKCEKKIPQSDIWLEIHSFPIFNQENKVVKVVEHMREISNRKKAEFELMNMLKELRSSEEEKRLSHYVIDNAGQAIFMIQEDGLFYRINDFACRLWGYSREELQQMKVWDINPKLTEKEWKKLWEKLNKEKILFFDTVHKTKNGEYLNMEITANLLEFEGQKFSVEFAVDVTEKKKAEKKLKDALNEIQNLKNKLEAENIYLQDEIKLAHNFEEIITQNQEMKKILANVEKVANTRSTVLILGETGTGKELIARAIHNISSRNNRPLVKVNCASLPASLIESELFGYEKGAFTGALYKKIGRFELADKGTIFLDEIGELPLELQPKLLRVLQDGEFERLGNPHTFKVDVRVIAATNRNLIEEVKKGIFRSDLYYRLNVFPISLPPLRQRKEDIPLLVNYFINKFSPKTGKKFQSVSYKTMASFQMYDWPGNIRELENVIERAMITSTGDELIVNEKLFNPDFIMSDGDDLSLAKFEREFILKVLRLSGFRIRGNKGAAKILGLKPTTLEARMKKLGIHKP